MLREKPFLEPLASFPASVAISATVHALGQGMYIRTRRPTPDLAVSVGWAESDYWAQRVWTSPPFSGDVRLVPPPVYPLPSPAILGLPTVLEYGLILAYERSQPQFSLTSHAAKYRLTDGAFLSLDIDGANRTVYHFGSTKPKRHERPVAIQFRLGNALRRQTPDVTLPDAD
jgi:hypothetical protein